MHKTSNNGKKGLYTRIDGTIMDVVNTGVHVWNRTTGLSRADLANLMLMASAGLQYIAFDAATNSRLESIAPTALFFIFGITQSMHNYKVDALEWAASKSGAMDIEVESYKGTCKILGPSSCTIGSAFGGSGALLIGKPANFLIKEFYSFGLLSGPSFYVMRADNPFRRNIIANSFEKVLNLLRKPELDAVHRSNTVTKSKKLMRQ